MSDTISFKSVEEFHTFVEENIVNYTVDSIYNKKLNEEFEIIDIDAEKIVLKGKNNIVELKKSDKLQEDIIIAAPLYKRSDLFINRYLSFENCFVSYKDDAEYKKVEKISIRTKSVDFFYIEKGIGLNTFSLKFNSAGVKYKVIFKVFKRFTNFKMTEELKKQVLDALQWYFEKQFFEETYFSV